MKKNPAYPWSYILIIIAVPKQYRSSRSCSTRQVLEKIPQIHKKGGKKTPAPEFLRKTLLKKKPHHRFLLRESVKTLKNTLNDDFQQ